MKTNNISRVKRTSFSIVFLGLYQITVFVCNLILPRKILEAYGSEYNGIISSITQFMFFISILRLGVAGATRVELYKSLASKDTTRTSGIIKATQMFMRKLAGVFCVYILILSIIYPLMVNSSFSWINISSLIVIISLGTFAQYFFGLTYTTLLQADQRLYIYNIIQIISTILNTILALLMIKLGFSIQIVKLGSACIFTLSPIILNIYVRKKYKINLNVEADKSALTKKNDVIAHSIANIIHENTDVVVLTLFTNIKTVSVYAVYNLVISGLKQLVTIFTSGLESIFGELWVKKEIETIKEKLNIFEYFIYSLVSIIFPTAFLLIIPFVQLYTRGIEDINYIIPFYGFLALCSIAFYYIRIPYLTITQAAGKYKETRNGAFLEAFINIFLSIIFTIKYGIFGVVIGTLAANIFRTIQYSLFVSKNLLNLKYINIFKYILWTISNVIISVFIEKNILNKIIVNSWKEWLIIAIICTLINALVVFVNSIIFYKKNIDNIKKILLKMFK